MLAGKLLKSMLKTRFGVLIAKIQGNLRVMEGKVKVKINRLGADALTLGPIAFIGENIRALVNLLNFRGVPTAEANKKSYNSPVLAEGYAQWDILRDPEKTILDFLKTKPSFRRMLDIGVGGGRTTKYFTEICKEYIGIDYSENMIKACRKKFQKLDKTSFAVIDARNMSVYKDNCFDFVLFSHGGLDAVEDEDRMRILHEIWRVTRNGGYFFFSSYNLDAMFQFCRVKLSKNPKVFAKMLVSLLLVRLSNQKMWKHVRGKQSSLEHTMFNIGGHEWGFKTYFIKSKAQYTQLRESSFENIRIFDLQGKEIKYFQNTTSIELHYLCNIVKPN